MKTEHHLGAGPIAMAVCSDLRARNLIALLDEVCERRGVLPHEVCGQSRTLGVCHARHELWWRIRNDPARHYSYAEIARLFRRDHTTVLHGIQAHEERKQQ